MPHARPTRAALCAAAFALPALLGACAGPPADTAPRDVRVVELSDEAADRIAARVADRLAVEQPQPFVRPAAPVVIRRRTPTRRRVRPTPRPSITFPTADAVAPEELRSAAQKAVDAALEWLAQHQSKDGAWRPGQIAETAASSRGQDVYTPGVTGLSVLCFLRNGETQTSGPHGEAVENGLRYLSAIQDAEGCFGKRTSQHFMYNHALASLAMIEGYAATENDAFRRSAQTAVNFVMYAQNPYMGWRYGVRDGDNDTSMTCWMVQVLAAARDAGLDVDPGAFRGAIAWVDKMTEPEFGRIGYNRRGAPPARTLEMMDRFPAEHSEATTAAGLLIRLLSGQRPETSELADTSATLISRKPPFWNVEAGTNDFYYWHLGSAALRRVGGERWTAWRNSLHAEVTSKQRSENDDGVRGSWDPLDAWSAEGGRIYATATLCLTLEELLISLE